MSFNLTTSEAILYKAGDGVSSTASGSGAMMAKFCDLAEATFSGLTRKNWVVNNAAASFASMIDDAVSDIAAMKVIAWDMSGYTSRQEAQTKLDLLRDNSTKIINKLDDESNRDLIS